MSYTDIDKKIDLTLLNCFRSEVIDFDISDEVIDNPHEALLAGYTFGMEEEPDKTLDFLKRYPQMETIHGQWRRVQQGFDPVSKYSLEDELVVSDFLSKYDPDLSISDVNTLFPEQIHELNIESFQDVCRRYGRDHFKCGPVYATGDSIVDDMFESYDEELLEGYEARMNDYYDEMAEEYYRDETEAVSGDEEVVLY